MTIDVEPITFVHPYPLDVVAKSYWSKFPHPKVPEVIDVKVLVDRFDPQTNTRYLERRLTIQQRAHVPALFRKVLGANCSFVERAEIDYTNNKIRLKSNNETFASIVLGREESEFAPHPDNPDWYATSVLSHQPMFVLLRPFCQLHVEMYAGTQFIQHGGVTASPYFGPLRSTVESFIAPKFRQAGTDAVHLLEEKIQEDLAILRKATAEAATKLHLDQHHRQAHDSQGGVDAVRTVMDSVRSRIRGWLQPADHQNSLQRALVSTSAPRDAASGGSSRSGRNGLGAGPWWVSA